MQSLVDLGSFCLVACHSLGRVCPRGGVEAEFTDPRTLLRGGGGVGWAGGEEQLKNNDALRPRPLNGALSFPLNILLAHI